MGSVRIRSFDGSVLVPAEGITSLDAVGTALVAQVPALGGPVVLAEGTPEEMSVAASSLMPGIADLGEGDWTLRAARSATGIVWQGTGVMPGDEVPTGTGDAGGGSAGAAWTAMGSTLRFSKKA
ncbi:hypothetical protein [Streptomyces sp. NBC_01198]|uniref:hypothetical protein n=1 Tax=Streptomyces sp. NBC_01198 TaxID=2903769 RepID=UPI002E1088E8|nr:hypothetical protein OG702_25370 [Streptomyces sp. NBC_01198]